MFMLDRNQSFVLNAYVTTPGPQTIIPKGMLIDRRSDGIYVASLLPDLFYGADGSQLTSSWRQNLTQTGDQIVLSRNPDDPHVPNEQLYWRKVSNNEEKDLEENGKEIEPTFIEGIVEWWTSLAPFEQFLIPAVSIGAVVTAAYFLTR